MGADRFAKDRYMVRRKMFKLFGAAFHIYDDAKNLCFYSKQKAFKLREDIRLYTGEDMREEVLYIQARQIVDFSAAYDVVDSPTGQKIGALKRKGWRSIIQDEWIVMDPQDLEIGRIREDHVVLALLRRLVTNLVPQRFTVEVGGREVCCFRQHFNPFVLRMSVDFAPGDAARFDRRVGLAAAVLLCAIEGRQN